MSSFDKADECFRRICDRCPAVYTSGSLTDFVTDLASAGDLRGWHLQVARLRMLHEQRSVNSTLWTDPDIGSLIDIALYKKPDNAEARIVSELRRYREEFRAPSGS
jgi:hypothetical protein